MRVGLFFLRSFALVFMLAGPGAGAGFAAAPDKAGDADSRYSGMKRFSHVYDYARRYYVREPGNDELMNGAIKGMIQGLDPHSAYLSPAEYAEMQETTSGEFVGIGIEITQSKGQTTVVSPIDDTPAQKAGLKAGDLILAVDGLPTQDLALQEIVDKIRGPRGTEVELLILSKDTQQPVLVKITREMIPVISVRTRFLGEGYLWLRISRFSENTLDELLDGLDEAKDRGEIKGIVLDLRNNPGGLLDQAHKISDVFLKEGAIVSIKGRDDDENREYRAGQSRNDISAPLVVLINAGSASAAEIVAGALQDHKRALLIGERSFGKGSVQSVIPMPDGSALKLTIALYYTPNGRSIQAEGIEPDMLIPFEAPREEMEQSLFRTVREQDLSGHLEKGESGEEAEESADAPDIAGVPDIAELLRLDNQLRMAYEMVKALPKFQEIRAE